MAKDPICGMEVSEEFARKKGLVSEKSGKEYFFCSSHCKKQFAERKWYGGHTISYGLSLLLVVVAGVVIWQDAMLPFMGVVLVILSVLKLIDLKGFADMFAQYDLVAKRSKRYGFIFPFIELGLGLSFLFAWQVRIAAAVLVVVMSVASIGVIKNLLSKNKVRCACLGAKIKIPLTFFTAVEDVVMVIMGIMILVW